MWDTSDEFSWCRCITQQKHRLCSIREIRIKQLQWLSCNSKGQGQYSSLYNGQYLACSTDSTPACTIDSNHACTMDSTLAGIMDSTSTCTTDSTPVCTKDTPTSTMDSTPAGKTNSTLACPTQSMIITLSDFFNLKNQIFEYYMNISIKYLNSKVLVSWHHYFNDLTVWTELT